MSESVVAADGEVDVGTRLRTIRSIRRLTLRDVSDRAGISESFLSQVERGRANLSIASLQRIAAALGIEVSDVFADGGAAPRVSRRDGRPTLSFGRGARKALVTPKPFHSLEVVVAEFEPGGSTGDDPYTHGDSEEVFFVVRGTLELTLADETFVLGPGDSVQYRSSTPHRVRNAGSDAAEVLFIITPPSY